MLVSNGLEPAYSQQQVRGNAQQNDLFVAEQVAFVAITDQQIASDRQIAVSLALCARSTEHKLKLRL